MHLQRLEISGFKSFAQKTVLEFPKPQKGDFHITAIVGPNGSGKSNLSDAIRWVLGEQSNKILRSKKSEDIIFSGSDKKTRLNLAEVNLFFNNEDGAAPIDYQEFTITRQLFRNGESEYLINNNRVRLQDILILLAKANFGQKSYSIVGQGMVDQILHSSPLERKKFFDEATGVKQYQIKRDNAARKTERAQNNLSQAQIAFNEIEPRMRFLTRQVKKLEAREKIEKKLAHIQKEYYGHTWREYQKKIQELQQKIRLIQSKRKDTEAKLDQIHQESRQLATAKIAATEYEDLEKKYRQALEIKNQLLEKSSSLKAKLFFEKEKSKQTSDFRQKIQINPQVILKELNSLDQLQGKLYQALIELKDLKNLQPIQTLAQSIKKKTKVLLAQCNPEEKDKDKGKEKANNQPKDLEFLENSLEKLEKEVGSINKSIQKLSKGLGGFAEKERAKRGQLFASQQEITQVQNQLNQINQKDNDFKIELARLETKNETLEEEVLQETNLKIENLREETKQDKKSHDKIPDYDQVHRLKHQLEMIGGIDPEVTKEYPQVKERYEFLSTQKGDLEESIKSLRKIIKELDDQIKKQFKESFQQINQEFCRYFKILFDGGNAKLILEETKNPIVDEQDRELNETEEAEQGLNNQKSKTRNLNGIEILATPPGKKIKSIETLSGGERALTSIALISAIIGINQPPFVLLDEVDAAFDEENSTRFAKIIQELNHHSQFIIITHNRQTMEAADIIYGITMLENGTSKTISLDLEK